MAGNIESLIKQLYNNIRVEKCERVEVLEVIKELVKNEEFEVVWISCNEYSAYIINRNKAYIVKIEDSLRDAELSNEIYFMLSNYKKVEFDLGEYKVLVFSKYKKQELIAD